MAKVIKLWSQSWVFLSNNLGKRRAHCCIFKFMILLLFVFRSGHKGWRQVRRQVGVCVCVCARQRQDRRQQDCLLLSPWYSVLSCSLFCAFFATLLNTMDVTRCQEAVKSAAFSEAGPYMLIKISGKVQAAVLCLLQTQPAMTRWVLQSWCNQWEQDNTCWFNHWSRVV